MGVIKADPLFRQLMERVPPSVSFSAEQTEALKKAFSSLNWKRHVVDIRFSSLGFYFILLGGIERRSYKRLTVERWCSPLLTPANLVVFISFSILLSLAGIGLLCQTKYLTAALLSDLTSH